MDQFEGAVLAATECRVADVIEAIVSSTMTLVLRLEFLFCPHPLPELKAERLQLYRLDASHFIYIYFWTELFSSTCTHNIWNCDFPQKETGRDFCGSFAIIKWLEERICLSSVDNGTRRILLDNGAPFRQDAPI